MTTTTSKCTLVASGRLEISSCSFCISVCMSFVARDWRWWMLWNQKKSLQRGDEAVVRTPFCLKWVKDYCNTTVSGRKNPLGRRWQACWWCRSGTNLPREREFAQLPSQQAAPGGMNNGVGTPYLDLTPIGSNHDSSSWMDCSAVWCSLRLMRSSNKANLRRLRPRQCLVSWQTNVNTFKIHILKPRLKLWGI